MNDYHNVAETKFGYKSAPCSVCPGEAIFYKYVSARSLCNGWKRGENDRVNDLGYDRPATPG